MTVDELLNLFCEALEVEAGVLSLDTVIGDVEEWDSLGWLSIIALLDERLGVQLTSKEAGGFHTVRDLTTYLAGQTSAMVLG